MKKLVTVIKYGFKLFYSSTKPFQVSHKLGSFRPRVLQFIIETLGKITCPLGN